jgi:hypothetical protein
MSDVQVRPGVFTLLCDMTKGCINAVTHIDTRGFVYCTTHGLQRRASEPCRKLRPWEIRRLERGVPLAHY